MSDKKRLDPRIRTALVFFPVVMAMLSLQRLAVLLATRDRFTGVGPADIFQSFLVGLRFDVVVGCILLMPLAVLLLPAPQRLVRLRLYQHLVAAYCAMAVALLLFLCIVDYYFFKEFSERLNHNALNYLGYSSTYAIIWDGYPIVLAVLLSLVAFAAFQWGFRRVAFSHDFAAARLHRLMLWSVSLVAFLIVGIRGSVGPKPINTGPAYFSDSVVLAQLTLNGPFTLREAAISQMVRNKSLREYVDLLREDEAFSLSGKLLGQPQDRFLGHDDNPLRRVTDTSRPQQDYNVVLVVLESINWPYVGAMGGDPTLMPELDALAEEGVLMDHCFSVGTRTRRGFSGIISGYPDLPGRSVTTRIETEGRFFTLGHCLERRGYKTMFIYAGQPMYDHRQAFLRSNGYSHMVFDDQFEARTFRTHLGWCDEDLYNQAHLEFVKMKDRPFFATLLTLSFHKPYQIPEGKIERADRSHVYAHQIDCVRYTDYAIGRFIEKAKQADYFDRTIFVFIADHMGGYEAKPITMPGFRVPFLIYAPSILGTGGRRISTVCSQTDVAPTIMSLLGGRYEHCFFGSNVLDRPAESGMALMQRITGTISFLAADGDVVVMPQGTEPRLYHYTAPDSFTPVKSTDPATVARREELRRRAVALLQSADILYARGSYRPATDAKTQSIARKNRPPQRASAKGS